MKTVYVYFFNNKKLKLDMTDELVDEIVKKLQQSCFEMVSSLGNSHIIINWKNVNYIQIY